MAGNNVSPGQQANTLLVGTISSIGSQQFNAIKVPALGGTQAMVGSLPDAIKFFRNGMSDEPIVYEDDTQTPSTYYVYSRQVVYQSGGLR